MSLKKTVATDTICQGVRQWKEKDVKWEEIERKRELFNLEEQYYQQKERTR